TYTFSKKTYIADGELINADRFLTDRRKVTMGSFNSLLALGLIVAPQAGAPHAYSQETRASAELLGASEIHSQSADLSSIELVQATSTTVNPSSSSADATVSVKALLDAKVLDASNR